MPFFESIHKARYTLKHQKGAYVESIQSKQIFRQALLQMGPLCFVIALIFKLQITYDALGNTDPIGAAISQGAILVIWALVVMTATWQRPRITERVLALYCIGVSALLLVGGFIAPAPQTPFMISLMFGTVCISEFFLVARQNPLNYRDTLLAASFAFGFSGLLCIAFHLVQPLYDFGIRSLGFPLLLSGILLTTKQRDAENADIASQTHDSLPTDTCDDLSLGALITSSAKSAIPVLLVCLVCSMSLGGSWSLNPFYDARTAPIPFTIGTLSACILLLVLRKTWTTMHNADSLLLSSAFPLALAIVLIASYATTPSSLEYTLAAITEFCFLAIIWAGALLLDRSPRYPGFTGTALLLYFFCLFAAFSLIGSLMSPRAAQTVMTLAACCGLVFLIGFAYQAHHPLSEAKTAHDTSNKAASESFSDQLDARCKELSTTFGLSARESELLPFFAAGMSASAIGERLFISPKTVNSHRYRIYGKLNVASKDELISLVWKSDMTQQSKE